MEQPSEVEVTFYAVGSARGVRIRRGGTDEEEVRVGRRVPEGSYLEQLFDLGSPKDVNARRLVLMARLALQWKEKMPSPPAMRDVELSVDALRSLAAWTGVTDGALRMEIRRAFKGRVSLEKGVLCWSPPDDCALRVVFDPDPTTVLTSVDTEADRSIGSGLGMLPGARATQPFMGDSHVPSIRAKIEDWLKDAAVLRVVGRDLLQAGRLSDGITVDAVASELMARSGWDCVEPLYLAALEMAKCGQWRSVETIRDLAQDILPHRVETQAPDADGLHRPKAATPTMVEVFVAGAEDRGCRYVLEGEDLRGRSAVTPRHVNRGIDAGLDRAFDELVDYLAGKLGVLEPAKGRLACVRGALKQELDHWRREEDSSPWYVVLEEQSESTRMLARRIKTDLPQLKVVALDGDENLIEQETRSVRCLVKLWRLSDKRGRTP